MKIVKRFISMDSVMCWFLFLVSRDKIPDKELLRQGVFWAPNLRRGTVYHGMQDIMVNAA